MKTLILTIITILTMIVTESGPRGATPPETFRGGNGLPGPILWA